MKNAWLFESKPISFASLSLAAPQESNSDCKTSLQIVNSSLSAEEDDEMDSPYLSQSEEEEDDDDELSEEEESSPES